MNPGGTALDHATDAGKPPVLRKFSITSMLVVTTLFALMFALLGGMLRNDATPLRPVYVLASLLAPTAAPVVVWVLGRFQSAE